MGARFLPRDLEDDANTAKDCQRRPKTCEDIRSLPKIAEPETALIFLGPSLRMCFANRDLAPSSF